MIGFISPFMLPLAAAALGLDFLRRLLQPQAPNTTPVAAAYIPTFTGGQCEGGYTVFIRFTTLPSGTSSAPFQLGAVTGKITGVEAYNDREGRSGIEVKAGSQTLQFDVIATQGRDFVIDRFQRTNGQPDNCGDLPNPNPPPLVSSDGLADSAPLAVIEDEELVIGAPLVTIPSIGAIVAAIAAAVRVASDALAAIKELVNAIETIGEILDKIRDWIEDRDKDNDKKKSLYRHDYGSIRKDGFLRLYPSGEQNGFSPQYVDLQLLSIPISYGKYFGNLSPNFYRFKSLGHISFVSPSFGVLSTHELEFSRISLTVPDNAFGFFYHLGLDDTIRANVSLFYLRSQFTTQ